MEYPGNLFVVAAPSGGQASPASSKALLELDAKLSVSVSRTPRGHPRAAKSSTAANIGFVGIDEFRDMVARGDFGEWAEVHGNLYGTSRAGIESRMAQGDDVVLEIDYQGALQIKQLFPYAVLIFVLPPSWEELKQRLIRRGDPARGDRHPDGQRADRDRPGPALRLCGGQCGV